MFDPQNVGKDFSNAADVYDEHAALQKRVLAQLAGQALPMLRPNSRILDAGCGTGGFARIASGHAVTQLDIASAMCRKAAQGGFAVCGSVEFLPFADESFDAVLSSLVLQWVPHWRRAMDEMKRVLKPGGVLAVSSFGPATLTELKESFAAADRYSHVSSFIPSASFEKSEIVVEHYPDIFALMRHLKRIGARNKLMGRRRSLMTPSQMQRVARRYEERFGTAQGLPVTWEILTSVSRIS